MSNLINTSDLFVELSTEEQQLLAGGRRDYDDDYDDYDRDYGRGKKCYTRCKRYCKY
jgi:hypothetical protein